MSRMYCRDINSKDNQMHENNSIEGWTFFSNNAHVLVCLTHTPQLAAKRHSESWGMETNLDGDFDQASIEYFANGGERNDICAKDQCITTNRANFGRRNIRCFK